MSNVFLDDEDRDVETAIMLEKAMVTDIGDAVAYTDGERVFVNTDENLTRLLPAYCKGMLKWLLWHERFHMELKHHNRFFKYLKELKEEDCLDEFKVTKAEVNIIMDILVHDSLSKMFPELVDIAVNNLAQMRNRNSLKYTFKTETLEEMLDEYRKHKHPEEEDEKEGEGKKEGEDKKEGEGKGDGSGDDSKSEHDEKEGKGKSDKKGHKEAESKSSSGSAKEDGEPEMHSEKCEPEGDHDKTDWSKLEKIDNDEFISKEDGDKIVERVNRLKRKKLKLGRLTQKLNGLATTTRERTYRMPSYIQVNKGILMKGKMPGKTALYLCFDASGSMGDELKLFKEIISKAIPQAMECPCEWFSGYGPSDIEKRCKNPEGRNPYDYYKGKFKDIMSIHAGGGYGDDGDRTIELCLKAEEKGFTPIGVTDGGGNIYEEDVLKKLKRTILVGPNGYWLQKAKKINPNIQILELE